jgi:tetratricopeptide (TPR) repeat protein
MKSLFFSAGIILLFQLGSIVTSMAQSNQPKSSDLKDAHGQPMLLGQHKMEDLLQPPYNTWFEKNYADYAVDSITVQAIAPLLKNKKLELFMGTWCGDSQREIPRIFKILHCCGVSSSQITLVMVDDHDSTYKQSPAHEEKGKNIFRVPDLIIYENNTEINRIVEYPVVTLEKDLLTMLNKQPYMPSYKGAALLINLVKNYNEINSPERIKYLAELIRVKTESSSELNSLAYVWMASGEKDNALTAFLVNAILYPTVSNVFDSLGEYYFKQGNKLEAKRYFAKVLTIDPANANATKMIMQSDR